MDQPQIGVPIWVQVQTLAPDMLPGGYFMPRKMERKRGFEPLTLSLAITFWVVWDSNLYARIAL